MPCDIYMSCASSEKHVLELDPVYHYRCHFGRSQIIESTWYIKEGKQSVVLRSMSFIRQTKTERHKDSTTLSSSSRNHAS